VTSARLSKPCILTRLGYFIQPGYNQSGRTSLTDEIGTLGCAASPNLYGCTLNRCSGVRPVRVALNHRIRLSRPPLPPWSNLRRGVWSAVPTQNGTPRKGQGQAMSLNTFIPPRHEWAGLPERTLCDWHTAWWVCEYLDSSQVLLR
jgi:hypothetical protein